MTPQANHQTMPKPETTTAAPQSASTFTQFNLPEKLQQALNRIGFTTPTPVQEQAIPLALAGRDILGSAQTGTGKTGAFGIPLIAGMMEDPHAMALIMTPTRELANQVLATLHTFINVPGIKAACLIGGEAMPKQLRQLNNRPRLIVGTPGRIMDHLSRGTLKLNAVKYLVLDETDRMLDMGFGPQLEKIMRHVPRERQTMLFSATLPANIVTLSKNYLTNPERITVGSPTKAAPQIIVENIEVKDNEKYPALVKQLETRSGSVIIFAKTKHGCARLADKLTRAGHQADAIHGDLRQSQRDRVLQSFRDKKFRILVATDVAARGLDVPHIETVINHDLPQVPEDYIHRIGRTARAGAEGTAVNLITPGDGLKWHAIQKLLNPELAKGPARSLNGARSNSARSFGRVRSGGAGSFGKPRTGGGSSAPRSSGGGASGFARSAAPASRSAPSHSEAPKRYQGERALSDAPRDRSDKQRSYAARKPRRSEGASGGGSSRRSEW